MATRAKLSLAIFLFFLLALISNLALGKLKETEVEEDPELVTCKHQCQQQRQYTESDKRTCLQQCDSMKQEREKQVEEETREKEEEHQEQHEEEEDENPYVFEEDKDFSTRVETEGGSIRVLKKFTEKSKLLQGIENFRLAILEARAHTFVSPRHFDSEVVLFNIKGRAVLGLVRESETEKITLEPGDMIHIPAGTPLYIVNRDENEKLLLAMLHIPVSTPGKFEEFFGPGGRDPESVLSAFSWNVLQAALQTPKGKLERLFNQQNEGSIFKISRERVRALAPTKKSSWWPFGGESKAQFNIFSKRPTFSNGYGRLTEVGPDDEKSWLQRLNLMLTFTNITQRSMSTIHYNSHATKIALVMDGRGHLQISCPHMSSRSDSKHDKSSPSYHRISADLKPGMVFVVPPGHPFVTIASNKENLLIICFEVNVRDNKKFTFAGKDNIVSSLDNVAKELAFNYPSEMVNGVSERKESLFFPFELPSEERGRRAVA
ncbi:sucrose-binding protein 2 precursor [Glycine max]|uniref:Sucrose-binding protein 2 n=1 Tax=Glycine max TaxID=3847 RepID=Q84V19_SOYBN|nr:sucrose-binding protein 2 precursor [Glycine max]AAO48716.1 sucrose-binding protein 2 [Glycine max]|eukprot:NP_001237244.1 sucrose-binding protein 2 precursor [Glycine max]